MRGGGFDDATLRRSALPTDRVGENTAMQKLRIVKLGDFGCATPADYPPTRL
jgi:hypothetical protein